MKAARRTALKSAAAALLFTAALTLPSFAAGDALPVEAIVGGTMVDLKSGKLIDNAIVLIEGQRIKAAGPASSITVPADAKLIHAEGKYILPGLMDMHVHLGLVLPGVQGMELEHETDAALALRIEQNARKTLLSGTTTVRLTGEKDHAEFPVKAEIDKGIIDGPRIFSAGIPIIPTAGHGKNPWDSGIDGKDAVIKFTREQLGAGATWIKIMISKGLADTSGDIANSDMTMEEMQAAVEIAHSHGAKVAAHDGSPVAAMQALKAGVDSFEHGYFFNKPVFEAIKKADKWYVPTIVVSQEGAMEFFKKIGSPPWYLARAKATGERHWAALQTAIKVGVNIAMGTDQFPFEPNGGTVAAVRETELYVDAGMTPLEALRAAMVNPAKMLGAEADLGGIEAGKYADIIFLTANPLQDIHALRTIGLVMKGGKVVRDDWAAKERPN